MNESLTTRGKRRSPGHGIGTLAVLLLLAAALRGVRRRRPRAIRPAPSTSTRPPWSRCWRCRCRRRWPEAIVDHRTYVGFFDDVYDLLEVEGMTPALFATLKPLVSTLPPPAEDASIARLSASYRQVRQYLGQEGSNEGLVDEYLDRMRTPENVNDLDLFDLMSYQNVSPVDATNILKARERLGRFESARQLRGTDGLRYFAYRNLRDFVVYSEDEVADSTSTRSPATPRCATTRRPCTTARRSSAPSPPARSRPGDATTWATCTTSSRAG